MASTTTTIHGFVLETIILVSRPVYGSKIAVLVSVLSSVSHSLAVSFEQGSRLIFSGWPFTDFSSESY